MLEPELAPVEGGIEGEEDVTYWVEDGHDVENIEDFIGEEVDDPVARILAEEASA